MAVKGWTRYEESRLRELWPGMTVGQIAVALGRAEGSIKFKARKLGLRKLTARRVWTDAEVAILRRRYPHERTDRIAADLGMEVPQVHRKANELGIRKTAEFLASPDSGWIAKGNPRGVGARFQPGQVPWNKGKPYPARGRSAENHFKPGKRQGVAVELYQPIGAERLTKEGILQRKVNDDTPVHRRWQSVHSLVWIEAHGPIPEGHVVVFKPGMATTVAEEITPDRLELVSRADLMRRNSVHHYPEELRSAVMALGQFKRRLREYQERQ